MAVETAEDIATLGRKVAQAQGVNPSTPGFDASSYGREVRYAMARGQGVPDPHDFVTGGAPGRGAAAASEGRRVRIGRVEVRLSDEPPARHRPQHLHHAGQRSSGRYRLGIEEQLRAEVRRRAREGRPIRDPDAYIYGTLRKTGWTPGRFRLTQRSTRVRYRRH